MVFGMGGGGNQMEVVISGDSTGLQSAIAAGIGSMHAMRGAAAGLGLAMTGVFAAGLGGAVKASADFDQAMTESMAVMGDVGAGMEENLIDTAREVARTTTASHTEAADSFYYLASAGLTAEESITAMPQVAALAEAGAIDMATATDYATDVMKAFGMEAGQIETVTDAMTGAVTRHNQTMDGMGQAMSYVAPVANGLGMSIHETAAAIGFLGDAGIKGSRAGTTLRQGLAKLSKQTGASADKLEELGVKTMDSEGNMLSMSNILNQLAASGATTADIMEIFGARAGPGMAVLLAEGGDALAAEADALENLKGVTQDVAAAQKQTLNAQLGILKSNLMDVAITIGSVLLPPLNAFVQSIIPVVQSIVDWIEAGNEWVAVGALVGGMLIGLLPVIGLLAISIGPAITAIVGLAGAFLALSAPVLAVIGVIGLLAAAWTTNFMNIQGVTQQVIATIIGLFQQIASTLMPIVQTALAGMELLWINHGAAIMQAIATIHEIITTQLGAAFEILKNIVQTALAMIEGLWQTHGAAIMTEIRAITQGIVLIMNQLFGFLLPIIQNSLNIILGFWQQHGADIVTFVSGFFAGLISIIGAAIDVIITTFRVGLVILRTVVQTVLALLQGDFAGAMEIIRSGMETALGLIHGLWVRIFNGIVAFITGWGTRMVQAIINILGAAIQAFIAWGQQLIGGSIIPDIFNAILTFIVSIMGIIGQAIATALQGWITIFQTVLGVLQTVVQTAWQIILTITQTVWAIITTAVQTALTTIQTVITTAFTIIQGVITAAWAAIQTVIQTALATIQTVITTVWNAIVAFITTVNNAIRTTLTTIWNAIVSLLTGIMGALQSMFTSIWNAISSVIQTVNNAISSALTSIWNAISSTLTSIMSAIQSMFDSVWSAIQSAIESIVSSIQSFLSSTWSAIQSTLTGIMNAISSMISSVWSTIQSTITSIVSSIQSFLTSAWNAILSTITSVLNQILSTVRSVFGQILSTARSIMSQVRTVIINAITAARRAFASQLNSMLSTARSILGRIVGAFRSAFSTIRSIASRIISTARNAASRARSALSSARSAASSASSRASNAVNSARNAAIAATGFQHGGLVTGPVLGLIGEGREHEAVLPLSRLDSMLGRSMAMGARIGSGDGGSGKNLNIRELTINANSRRGGRDAGNAFVRTLRSHGFD